jgi:hypothetical protein
MTIGLAPVNAKDHRQDDHKKTASLWHNHNWLCMPLGGPAWGSPLYGAQMSLCTVCRSGWPAGWAGVAGEMAARVLARGVFPHQMLFAGPQHPVGFTLGQQCRVQP